MFVWFILLNLPLSLLLLCVFLFANFLAGLTVNIQTPIYLRETMDDGHTVRIFEDHQEGKHLLPTHQRGFSRACDFDLWVADWH